jgi:ketosteroid isomerase-like protein
MESSKQSAFAVWRAFESRDPSQIRDVLADDVRWFAPRDNATQVALGLPPDMLETRDGIVAFLNDHFRRLFPDGASFDFTKVVAEGDTVVFELRMRARLANGRDYDNRYCWVFEMAGARVKEIREYMDTYGGYRMIFAGDPPGKIVG